MKMKYISIYLQEQLINVMMMNIYYSNFNNNLCLFGGWDWKTSAMISQVPCGSMYIVHVTAFSPMTSIKTKYWNKLNLWPDIWINVSWTVKAQIFKIIKHIKSHYPHSIMYYWHFTPLIKNIFKVNFNTLFVFTYFIVNFLSACFIIPQIYYYNQ